MSNYFISFEISSTVTHVKEKVALFSKLDIILLIINTKMFLVFLNSLFNWIRDVRNIAEVLLINFDSKDLALY